MSKPKVTSCDVVPRTRAQRSVAATWPEDSTGYREPSTPSQPVTRYSSSDGIGRFPTIGIDPGSPRWATPGANLK